MLALEHSDTMDEAISAAVLGTGTVSPLFYARPRLVYQWHSRCLPAGRCAVCPSRMAVEETGMGNYEDKLIKTASQR